MPRIKLTLPEKFHYETKINIRITDINYGGHLGNDALLGILQEVRIRFLNHYGYSEMDLGGCGIIMSDSAIVYKNEGFYNDELLIEVAVDDISKVSFDIYYSVKNLTRNNLHAVAKTGIVCFNYAERKVAEVPEKFAELFQ